MRAATAPKRTFLNLARRLELVGLKREFVRSVLVPSWWTREDEKDPQLLAELEFSIARFLKAPIDTVRDPMGQLAIPATSAKLRKPKNLMAEDVAPAVYTATMIAQAAVRNLRDVPEYRPLPDEPLELRAELLAPHREAITLRALISGLWERGIPVIRISTLPAPKFRGMACWVKDRPVVILAWGGVDSPKHLNDLAHETGHIACGHVSADSLTVDGEKVDDESDQIEKEANAFQATLLYGEDKWPDLAGLPVGKGQDMLVLARDIRVKSKQQRIDAGLLAHCWVAKTREYRVESYLLRVLDKLNAVHEIDAAMKDYIDFAGASETDANLLRCVFDEASD